MEAKVIAIQPDYAFIKSIAADTSQPLRLFSAAVRAGFPSPAADYTAEPIDLNAYVSQNPTSTFLVRVEGDSMIGAHIEPGDLAVVDRSVKAVSGKVVLAFIEGEFTIKRLLIKEEAAYLVPENPAYSSIRIDHAEGGRIWGVVVGLVKKL